MKRTFTLLAFLLSMSATLQAQISTFPHTEGFEAPFATGPSVNFLPNWWANYITPDTIMQDTYRPHSGTSHITMIPRIHEFLTIVEADLDFTGRSNMAVELWAASDTNDVPSLKQARLFVTASLDGGVTWYPEVELAPNGTFDNATTPYELYTFAFHSDFDNQANVKCRIFGKSGMFHGSAARLLIDDVTFYESPSDVFKPIALEPKVIDENSAFVIFSEPVGPSAEVTSNYTIDYGLSVASATLNANNDTVTLAFATPMTHGLLYTIDIANVEDIVGNEMDSASFEELIFNPVDRGIVISEILYDQPPTGSGDSIEYVEIYNRTCEPLQIGGMRIKYGIQTGLLPYYTMQPGEYYVTAKDSAAFHSAFGFPADFIWRGGSLSNSGEYLEFLQADHHAPLKLDSVVYSNAAPWPLDGAGLGSSIEMCNNHMDNIDGANWQAATFLATILDSTEIYATPGAPCDSALNPHVFLGTDGVRCTDTTYTLDAGNPGSVYLWSTGDTTQTIEINTSGIYSVIVNNGTGAAYDTIDVTIAPGPGIVADWTGVSGPVCPYDTISFVDNTVNAVSWQWDFGEGTTSTAQDTSVYYTSYGTYYVTLTVTDANGCLDDLTMPVEIDGCLGVEEVEQVDEIMVYPNPSNGDFSLEVSLATSSNVQVQVLDINGRVVFEDAKTAASYYEHKFDASLFTKGMYLVKIATNNKLITKKVVIN